MKISKFLIASLGFELRFNNGLDPPLQSISLSPHFLCFFSLNSELFDPHLLELGLFPFIDAILRLKISLNGLWSNCDVATCVSHAAL